MRNIHDPNEYHKYKSISDGSENSSSGGSGNKPSVAGWIVIIIVGYFFLHFLFSRADGEIIMDLLGYGLILYLIVNWLFK